MCNTINKVVRKNVFVDTSIRQHHMKLCFCRNFIIVQFFLFQLFRAMLEEEYGMWQEEVIILVMGVWRSEVRMCQRNLNIMYERALCLGQELNVKVDWA